MVQIILCPSLIRAEKNFPALEALLNVKAWRYVRYATTLTFPI